MNLNLFGSSVIATLQANTQRLFKRRTRLLQAFVSMQRQLGELNIALEQEKQILCEERDSMLKQIAQLSSMEVLLDAEVSTNNKTIKKLNEFLGDDSAAQRTDVRSEK